METGAFLFTDIEGSTRSWAEHPDEMGRLLSIHDRLITAAVNAAGGHVFKHTGDGICAAFASVGGALQAAARAQRVLTAADWAPLRQLRARMAVHVGEAERRDDDWFGPALNRTARLMGIAHGGQIIVSGAVHEVASEGAVQPFTFADLGVHRLRDLSRAEHVWQLVGNDLERSFPPLRSFDGYRGRLPSQSTSFVGREEETDVVAGRALLNRLVTLVGPGGVGKSRLAGQVAAGLIDKFSEGAWMFELAAVTGADGIVPLMIATLGLSGAASTDARSTLLEATRGWRALFVVDNCEHLLGPAGRLVRDVLDNCPDITILATSREPLHMPGEQVVVLRPLDVATDAVRLFIDRAAAVSSTTTDPDGSELVAIGRICARLDGMPLAIELAAARTLAMTPAEIEQRLDQRFRLLSQRSGDRDDRHGSLARIVEWSYEMLEPDTRSFFTRLAVFAGTFDSTAAASVCWPGDEFAVFDMLEDLVAKSLVTATPSGARTAYRLLETMRHYGLQQLGVEHEAELRQRHGDHFAGVATDAWDGCRGPDSAAWLHRINEQVDDIRVAFERAISVRDADHAVRIAGGLFIYNHTRRLPEVYGWIDQALRLPGVEEHPLYDQLRIHHAYRTYMSGKLAESEQQFTSVIDDLDDASPLLPRAAVLIAGPLGNLRKWPEAHSWNNRAVAMCADVPDAAYELSEALWNICALSLFAGEPDIAMAERFLQMARGFGNPRALAGGLLMCGVMNPDVERGLELLAEARELTARTRDTYRHGISIFWLGVLRATIEPAAILHILPELVRQARTTGQRLLLLQAVRDCMPALVEFRRFDDVARLDGIGLHTTARPQAAAAATVEARAALGDRRYDELRTAGSAMSLAELEVLLIAIATDFV